MEEVLAVSNLGFSYNGTSVLKDVSFSLNAGDYISIIGPNGAGKSTLLKCINRVITGASGSIKVLDTDLDQITQKQLGRLVGYVPQNREQLFGYSVYDFILMGRYPYIKAFSYPSKEDHKVVAETIALTGLNPFKHRRINALSGGERQMVYLAGALAQKPKILLLDEPTTHLDPLHHKEIIQTMLKIAKELNITVLHVTHDLNHIMSTSEKVMAIKDGEMTLFGSTEEIVTEENLLRIFDTSFLFVPHPTTGEKLIIPEIV